MLWVACPSRPVPIADGKRCMFPPITATFGGPVAGSLYGHVRRPRRPGPNMVFVVPVAGSATGTAGTTGHADDSALRGCHESRGTRYSERHSAQIDVGDIEYRRPGVRASALGLALPSLAGATHVYEMKVAENDARRAEPLGPASPPDYRGRIQAVIATGAARSVRSAS